MPTSKDLKDVIESLDLKSIPTSSGTIGMATVEGKIILVIDPSGTERTQNGEGKNISLVSTGGFTYEDKSRPGDWGGTFTGINVMMMKRAPKA